jgi:MYXO-CTERM domain-containing protein
MGDYAPSQTPWSLADLPWARGTSDATVAARSDFAQAFIFAETPSDIPYARREWTMLPEGEVVVIDRVHTSAASRNMYVTLHTNTGGGGLTEANGVYLGKAGSSQVAIHPVLLSGGTPAVTQPTTGDCTVSCNYPCAECDNVRFAVDEYQVKVPGTWAVAVHVIDGLGASESPATVDSMNDATIDPAAQNGGILGASVLRTAKQTYVVASSAVDGVSPTTMTYGVPGTGDGRHIVFDAPEASDGTSAVTTTTESGRCVVSISAGSGQGFTGHPLMFNVAAASVGCAPTDSTSVSPSPAPGGDGGVEAGSGSSGGGDAGTGSGIDGGHGADGGPGNGASSSPSQGSHGCGCTLAGADRPETAALVVLGLAGLTVARSRSRRRRSHERP